MYLCESSDRLHRAFAKNASFDIRAFDKPCSHADYTRRSAMIASRLQIPNHDVASCFTTGTNANRLGKKPVTLPWVLNRK